MTVPSPVVLAVLAAACFGLGLVLTQYGLRHMRAIAGASVSIPTTTLLAWLASPWALDSGGWRPTALAVFALVGLFFPAVVTLLTFESNRRMGPTVTGTVGSTAPLFAIGAALLFLGERLTPAAGLAALAIVGGVALLSWQESAATRRWPRSALLLPLAGACLRGAAQAITKYGLVLWPSPVAATLAGYTVSTAVVLAALQLHGKRADTTFNRQGVAWFTAVGTVNGGAVFLLYAALNRGPVTEVAPIVAAFPVFTLLLEMILLREERLTVVRCAGVALTVAGVMVLLR